jgi:predicted small metal-binding protein
LPKASSDDLRHPVLISGRRCGMQKRVECECGWSQQTDDEATLVSAVQQHAKSVHNMDGVTREQVLAQARPV